jgi:hypothetical protein
VLMSISLANPENFRYSIRSIDRRFTFAAAQ